MKGMPLSPWREITGDPLTSPLESMAPRFGGDNTARAASLHKVELKANLFTFFHDRGYRVGLKHEVRTAPFSRHDGFHY